MAIQEGERFDPSTKRWVGKVTLPTHTGLARKALVFMVAGLTRRYKDAVAYYFTNKRDPACEAGDTGKAMADIITTGMKTTEKRYLCTQYCEAPSPAKQNTSKN